MIIRLSAATQVTHQATKQTFVRQCCPDPLFITTDTQLNTEVKCAQCGKNTLTIIKD